MRILLSDICDQFYLKHKFLKDTKKLFNSDGLLDKITTALQVSYSVSYFVN